jgi:hypothetical protein
MLDGVSTNHYSLALFPDDSNSHMSIEDETLIWLRFEGEGLDIRGVPVYELGEVLIALQRIVHKAYPMQKTSQRQLEQLAATVRQDRVLQNLMGWLVKLGIDKGKQGRCLRRLLRRRGAYQLAAEGA